MYSFSCTAFVTKIAPLVQSTLRARLHTWRRRVNVAQLQTVCEGMPRRKKLSHQSTTQPPAKVPKLSEPSQPTNINTVASQRADTLIFPALALQVQAMSSEKPQTEPVQLEGKLQHSADAVAGAVGFAGDSHLASEVAGVQDGPKKNRRGKKSAGKDHGGKKQQGTRQPAQSEFGNSYSQLVRQHRPVNRRGVVLREDTDDSVRSTDDPSSAGISDAGSSTWGKRRNNAGSRPAQRSMTFFRKPAAPQSSLVDNKATPDDSTDSITEAGVSVGERRRRRRKKKPLPSGPLQLEPSELKPEVDLLEDAVPPTTSASRTVHLRESVSSDEIGNSLSRNFLEGNPKSRTAKSTRPRQRNKRNKQSQVMQSALDDLQAEQHGDEDSSGLGSFVGEAAAPVPGATGTKSSASRRGDPPLTNQGRGNRLPPNRNQAGQRNLTFYRKKSTEKSWLQDAVAEPNSTQVSSETPEQMTPTSTRKKKGKYNKASKMAKSGLLPSQSAAVAQTSQTESLEAVPSPGAGQRDSPAQGLPVRPHTEGQGEAVEKPKGEATETRAGAKIDVITLAQRKRPTKTKAKLTAASAKEKTNPIPVSKGRSKLVVKTSDKAKISAAAGWGRGNSEEKEVTSGVLQAVPLDCASVDSPDAATTDDGAGEAQKGKRTKRRKRKLLSSSGAGSSAPSESVGAEETADEVASSQPAEIVPKKKKGGKLSPHGGKDPMTAEPARGKSDKKAMRKHRPKILPDSLLSLVTAYVKRDPSLARKLGELSIAEEVRKKTEHALSGRKHRSSESDCPPEDSKKAKLSSGVDVDEAGVLLSVGDSSDTESTKASAVTVASDDILGIVADIPLVLEKSSGKNTTSAKVSKKKKKNKKKKKGKHSAAGDNEEGTDDKDEKKMEKPRKIPPNYFVAIQVDDPEIHEELQKVQRHVLLQSLGLMPAFIPLPTLHLTLAVMHLANQQDIDRAKAALDSCCQELQEQFPTDPLMLHVSGLDHFRNQVVFARVRQEEALQQLKNIAATVEKALFDEKLLNSDKDNFKAHITIMKTSKAFMQLRKNGIRSIPSETYSDFLHGDFGVQYAHRLQLCAMMKKKRKDGYYQVEHEVDFAPETGETTRLQKFCRRLAQQSVAAALQKLREERGPTAEAEKEAETMQLSKSIVAFSIQSAVAQLKEEQWQQKKQEKKEAEKREREERRKEKKEKEKRKKEKGGKAAAGTEAVQAAEETESQAVEERKVGAAGAGSEASQDASTTAAAEPEQADTQAVGGTFSKGDVMPGEVRDEEADSKEVKDGVTAGEQMGSGGEREGPVPVEMKGALEAEEPGDSEKGRGGGDEKEREDGDEKEREDGDEEREEEESGATDGDITPAELDALCKELVERCVEEAMQHFRKQNSNSDREEDEDEGTSV